METLPTNKQRKLLEIIYHYIQNSGFPPSFEEMREVMGVKSNQSVVDLLDKLEKQGLIRKNAGAARSLTILPLGYQALDKRPLVPFLGVSHAGLPVNTVEITGEWQELSGGFAKLTNEIFILKVSGDSMINAGINDGNKVLVQSQKEFSSDDLVVADIDGETTIKRFVSDDNPPYVYLKPENPNYKIIPFTHRMRLVGKVISVFN